MFSSFTVPHLKSHVNLNSMAYSPLDLRQTLDGSFLISSVKLIVICNALFLLNFILQLLVWFNLPYLPTSQLIQIGLCLEKNFFCYWIFHHIMCSFNVVTLFKQTAIRQSFAIADNLGEVSAKAQVYYKFSYHVILYILW